MAGYVKRFEVRWTDLDMNRHMRNTAYSEYCIDVRVSLLQEHGFGFAELGRLGFGPVILREEARYFREIGAGQTFDVDFRLAGLAPDGSRWRVEHEVRRGDGERSALLSLEGLWLDLATRRPIPPPPELLGAFLQVERTRDFEELNGRRGGGLACFGVAATVAGWGADRSRRHRAPAAACAAGPGSRD
jgi:acyl-CoA thioester hydrolase